ncbi:DUF4132 domain-containing protein [Conexibacter sp. CPCC 206217]|uniref:DUF4132 domain-containing protein n=1 Tax=Conexibacter sp. CPCC 206217 TaxID=3064574 RepID=UPI0027174E1E|nr:DUF4132 domain-containing protein [Conexibacter sp. CPCC 206217]MDO8209085.1 DUF4132 domain-containing protein [Conexibacter sp. CPCC 206217]
MRTRTYVFEQGTSHKFWAVAVDGPVLVTRWGRVGTDGQEKQRAFADGAAATAAADKLVGEKTRKGYVADASSTIALRADAGAVPAPPRAARPAADAQPTSPGAVPPAPGPADRSAIELTPQELALPSWLPLPPPLQRSDAPVDVAAVRRGLRGTRHHWGWWHWADSPFGDDVSPATAAFWLRLAYHGGPEVRNRRPAEALRAELERGLDVELSRDDILRLSGDSQLPEANRLPAALALLPATDIVEVLIGGLGRQDGHSAQWDWAARARTLLLPLLSEADRASLREAVERSLRPQLSNPDDVYGLELTLAGALGMHEEVELVVATWPDNWLGELYGSRIGHMCELLGLATAERFVEEAVRLGLDMSHEVGAATWLAVTGTDRLDWLQRTLLRSPNRGEASVNARAFFRRVHHPAMAPVALAGLGSRAPDAARAWLDDHPAEAVAGLAPLLSRSGASADAARDELRRLLRTSATSDASRRAAAQLQGPAAERVAALAAAAESIGGSTLEQTPAWLEATEPISGRLPGWLDPAALPPLLQRDGEAMLREQDVVRLLLALKQSVDDVHPAAAARAELSPASADEFAWALFSAWSAAGAPARDAWALLAVGQLGGDRSAQRLTPLVRAWPGEGRHSRARTGLRVLRTIGSETALMLLNGIAQRLRFKGLQNEARTAMEQIARERGLSRAQLEDRIVPDAGLDADGSRSFDYGPRQFSFVLGPQLKPMVRDSAGKLRATLPPPGVRDDPALADAAREQWRELRRFVADTTKLQVMRLEDAMVTQRSWSVEEFTTYVAPQPLLRHLVRLLVLAASTPGARRTFRLTDEGDLADADDAPFALAADERVTIVHPLQLDRSQRAAWSETLAADEIVPPFPQLGRSVADLRDDELAQQDITRFATDHVPPRTLVGLLDRRGWHREGIADGGLFSNHVKEFPAAGVTVTVEYDGIPVGSMEDADPQAVERCYAVVGSSERAWEFGSARGQALHWGEVDPIVRCEVLADLLAIQAKALA